jgi:hypothetical protein
MIVLRTLTTLLVAWSSFAWAAAPPSFPPLGVIKSQAAPLAAMDSNGQAMTVFGSTVGPALGLRDAAATLTAKTIPAKVAAELNVAELSATAQKLMAALAAWQWADSIIVVAESPEHPSLTAIQLPSAAREEWLTANGAWTALPDVLRLARSAAAEESSSSDPAHRTALALAAHRLASEASQQTNALWWNLQGWKDRVRNARGRARLCGTWQWVIHNHQNHQEQKTSMIFAPAGQEKPGTATPAEIVVLGDSIYLRWEMNGQMQEDSLLFIKDGSRIEGSFINSLGGWGSITGKRTAICQS